MSINPGLEQCLAFINSQVKGGEVLRPADGSRVWRAVTISRQSGCAGEEIIEQLRRNLQAAAGDKGRPWTVFDRNLLEQVLADHQLPQRLASFMPEDRIPFITDTMEEIFGLHPATWVLARQTAETILHLAELGNVILVGRGANVVTAAMPDVFQVRLIGSLEKRIARVQARRGLDRTQALRLIRREDGGRARYLRQNFKKAIDDPLLYHLVINTDSLSAAEVANVIGHAMVCG